MAENEQSFYDNPTATAPAAIALPNLNNIRAGLGTPPTNYPECENVYREPQKTTFYAKNSNCILCNNTLDQTKSIVLLDCQHAYHYGCGESYLNKGSGNQCPRCTKMDDSGETLFRIDHGNDPSVTRELERQTRVKQGISIQDEEDEEEEEEDEDDDDDVEEHGEAYYQAQYGDRALSVFQKNKLTKGIYDPRKIYGTKIDIDYLIAKKITLDDLLSVGLNLYDIYFSIGAQKWDDLKELGMNKKYLLSKDGEFMPLGMLIDLYEVDYYKLKQDLNLTLKDAVALNIDAQEFKQLGMSFENLLDERLGKKKINQMKDDISCADWIQVLGMNKGHLLALKFNLKDFEELGWNLKKLATWMKLSDEELKTLGIFDKVKPDTKKPLKSKKRTPKRPSTANSKMNKPKEIELLRL